MALPESRQLDFDEIPVIEISRLHDNNARNDVVRAIDRACRDIGFFYIVDHGFDMRLVSRLQQVAGEFFSLPESQKLELGLDPSITVTIR
jgi:isopenicillin N synthase-like dioxygenase